MGAEGSTFRVHSSGFRVQGKEFRVQGSRFRVQSSEFRVQGGTPRRQRAARPGVRSPRALLLPPLTLPERMAPTSSRGGPPTLPARLEQVSSPDKARNLFTWLLEWPRVGRGRWLFRNSVCQRASASKKEKDKKQRRARSAAAPDPAIQGYLADKKPPLSRTLR